MSGHRLVGIKITIPVLPSLGLYTSDNPRSCVIDDCFDLSAFGRRKILVRKMAVLYKKLIK